MSKMEVIVSEDGKRITKIGPFPNRSYTFELVDKVPVGYSIWNILSKNMPDGYLPLCRLSSRQPFPGGRNIDTESLKAIKVEGAQIILDAVGGGEQTVKEMEAYIACHQNAKPDTWAHAQVERMKKALPIMRQIKGL